MLGRVHQRPLMRRLLALLSLLCSLALPALAGGLVREDALALHPSPSDRSRGGQAFRCRRPGSGLARRGGHAGLAGVARRCGDRSYRVDIGNCRIGRLFRPPPGCAGGDWHGGLHQGCAHRRARIATPAGKALAETAPNDRALATSSPRGTLIGADQPHSLARKGKRFTGPRFWSAHRLPPCPMRFRPPFA